MAMEYRYNVREWDNTRDKAFVSRARAFQALILDVKDREEARKAPSSVIQKI